jgi:hypothetical protein
MEKGPVLSIDPLIVLTDYWPIDGVRTSRKGNKAFKRALFLSAFASLKDPACRTYCGEMIHPRQAHDLPCNDRKRGEGKRDNQAS